MKIVNKHGFRYGMKAYLIGNEFGLICVSYANNEKDALDYAAEENCMDSERMSDIMQSICVEMGWWRRFILLGPDREPFRAEHLWIKPASERVKTSA